MCLEILIQSMSVTDRWTDKWIGWSEKIAIHCCELLCSAQCHTHYKVSRNGEQLHTVT